MLYSVSYITPDGFRHNDEPTEDLGSAINSYALAFHMGYDVLMWDDSDNCICSWIH